MELPRRRERVPWDALWILDHVAAPERVDRWLPGLREAVHRRTARALARLGPGDDEPVPEAPADLSAEALHRDYVSRSLPVVMRGASASWPCRTWSLASFAERFDDTPIRLMNASTRDVGAPRDGGEHPLGDVLRGILAGSRDYPRFVPLLHHHPELLDDLDLAWLEGRRGPGSAGRNLQLFLGGDGSDTALHNAPGSNLFVQIRGRKEWRIVPPQLGAALRPELDRAPYFFTELDLDDPDTGRYPWVEHVRGWRVVLEPGDVLYVPPFAWHAVRNHGHNVGLGYRWYALGPLLRSSPTQVLLTVLSTNPPLWKAAQLRHDFARVFAQGGRSSVPLG